jgi:pyruvate dehydrogenase complex dehydrogenase (E1) component
MCGPQNCTAQIETLFFREGNFQSHGNMIHKNSEPSTTPYKKKDSEQWAIQGVQGREAPKACMLCAQGTWQ